MLTITLTITNFAGVVVLGAVIGFFIGFLMFDEKTFGHRILGRKEK